MTTNNSDQSTKRARRRDLTPKAFAFYLFGIVAFSLYTSVDVAFAVDWNWLWATLVGKGPLYAWTMLVSVRLWGEAA